MQTWSSVIFVDVFNSRWLNWLGLITRKPVTEDYVPVLPWLGVMWWGVALGVLLKRSSLSSHAWLARALTRPLAHLGQWSLSYYMFHQPEMVGTLMVWGWVSR